MQKSISKKKLLIYKAKHMSLFKLINYYSLVIVILGLFLKTLQIKSDCQLFFNATLINYIINSKNI